MTSILTLISFAPITRIARARTVAATSNLPHRSGEGWGGAFKPLLLILLLSALCPTAVAAENESADAAACVLCDGIRPQDEIVVVSTRRVCNSCNGETLRNGVTVSSYAVRDEAGHRRWQDSSLEEFLAFDASVPTIIFVHGNQITSGDAKSQGLSVYRRLMHYGCNEGRVRFVVFSWPSEKIGFILRDVRVKACRTAPAGCQLAWLMDQMPAETPVSLVGFSFGARIITGGLHILAGGRLDGLELRERVHAERAPVNVVLIAAALHAHWLGEGQHHGLALSQVDRMLLVNNCQDVALRYYHLSTRARGSRPQALGMRGPTCINSEQAAKIQERDVARYAGSKHELFRYLCAPGVVGQLWAYTGGAATAPTQVAQR